MYVCIWWLQRNFEQFVFFHRQTVEWTEIYRYKWISQLFVRILSLSVSISPTNDITSESLSVHRIQKYFHRLHKKPVLSIIFNIWKMQHLCFWPHLLFVLIEWRLKLCLELAVYSIRNKNYKNNNNSNCFNLQWKKIIQALEMNLAFDNV